MKHLMMGMLLLLGACAVSEERNSAKGAYGGDINSPEGRAWRAAIDNKIFKAQQDGNGGFKEGALAVVDANGDLINFINPGETNIFAGALSATRAFYYAPQIDLDSIVQEAGTKLEGFFISNVEAGGVTTPFVYTAALTLSQDEIDTVKMQLGIKKGTTVDQATLEQKREYYRIVHKPGNFNFEEPETDGGYPKDPIGIIKTP